LEVISVSEEKKLLFKLISNSEFTNFVNFEKLEKYLKTNFNKPIFDMLIMLEVFKELLEKQINLLRITKSNSETLDLTLEKKEIVLNHQLKILKNNIIKLNNSTI
jgi:hypothetical protein